MPAYAHSPIPLSDDMQTMQASLRAQINQKSVSGLQNVGEVAHRDFAANDPAWHQGCETVNDRTTSEHRYYHLDHLGTPDTLTDENGEIAWSVSYQTYGNVALKHINRIEQPLRFQGQYEDEETGLYYNRFRYYDPNVGQFTQQDPIGLLGGINNYLYTPNPVHWVDPFGLSCKEGYAVIHKKGSGDSVHFGIEVNSGGRKTFSHQLGGYEGPGRTSPTKTLVDDFDPNDWVNDAGYEEIKIKLDNPEAAQKYQQQLKTDSMNKLLDANGDPNKLNTPEYDIESQSCLTHCFDVMKQGGRADAPSTSPPDRSTARYMRNLRNESKGKK